MKQRNSDELIRELSGELAPVRRIPSVRAMLAAGFALWLAGLGAEWLLAGRVPSLRSAAAWLDEPYLTAFAGLLLVALGATSGALADAVPGRELAARSGERTAALGLSIALAGGLWGLAGGGTHPDEIRGSLPCLSRALILGLAPAFLTAVFVSRAALRRAGRGGALALAGGVALGAWGVHATCPSSSALHQLVGHTLAPVLAAAVLGLPLALLIGIWSRRARLQA